MTGAGEGIVAHVAAAFRQRTTICVAGLDVLLAEIAVQAMADAGFGNVAEAQAQALAEAADALYDLPATSMECAALIEEWKDGLNVDHGIQASVRWLKARAEFIGAAS